MLPALPLVTTKSRSNCVLHQHEPFSFSLSLSLLLRNRLNYFLSLSPRKVASRTSDAVVAARARACETDVVEVDLTNGLVVVGESDREMAIQKYRIVV